jgi:2-polyprenyl-3-methyl-5-hydroxy-6-metoxy-1,4-benzoquinol methylase
MEPQAIAEQARALAPWRFNIEILPGLWTADCNPPSRAATARRDPSVVDPQELKALLSKYYPDGLRGKDVLDVNCNAGSYVFLAHEWGARTIKGIEMDELLLAQARFVKSIKYPSIGVITFARRDASEYFETTKKHFDVVLFQEFPTRLVDPIHVLMGYCDLARETLIVTSLLQNCLSAPNFAGARRSRGARVRPARAWNWRRGVFDRR